jgi:hypothetical protein
MRLRDEKTLLREPYKKDVLLIYYLERGSVGMKHESCSNGDKRNNSVTVTTGDNERLRTMTRTMTTSALVTIDTIAPFDMGGNITLRSRMDLLIH